MKLDDVLIMTNLAIASLLIMTGLIDKDHSSTAIGTFGWLGTLVIFLHRTDKEI